MSGFDIQQDGPGLLRIEALNMALSFSRTSDTTGIISWNIPTPAAGCAAGTQAYDGILITLDTTPVSSDKLPCNGQAYTSDPTASQNLFAGDRLGSSMVIGAFYNNKTTTSMTITGLMPNTPYYVSGFPVDAQFRYFYEGVHAYSLDYAGKAIPFTQGQYIIQLNGSRGALPTDFTGLNTNVPYDFYINLNSVPEQYARGADVLNVGPSYHIKINGSQAQTFQDMINAINGQLAFLGNYPIPTTAQELMNPIEVNVGDPGLLPQGPLPPQAGAYYWDSTAQKLYLWDGYTLTQQQLFIQATPPNALSVGTFWYNPTTKLLYAWNGLSWTPTPFIISPFPPNQPICDSSVWLNTSNNHTYLWDGTTWVDKTSLGLTYNQPTDPSQPVIPVCGSYWNNSATKQFFHWDESMEMWVAVTPIASIYNPSAPTTGTSYWVNSTTNVGYVWGTPTAGGWNVLPNPYIVATTTPPYPAANAYWYNPSTMILQQWNGTVWVNVQALVQTSNPTVRNSGDIWWNATTNVVSIWNSLTTAWVAITGVFYNQPTDPTTPASIADGTYWYNSATSIMYEWISGCWKPVGFVAYPTNPILAVVPGTVWQNDSLWFQWNGTTWTPITPVVSTTDPSALPAGTLWFNTTSNTLNQWNGATWINLMYLTTSPVPKFASKPKPPAANCGSCNQLNNLNGAPWYNTSTQTLMTWNGTTWVPGIPPVTLQLDKLGNLMFTNTNYGNTSTVVIKNPFNNLAGQVAYGNLFDTINTYNQGVLYGPQSNGQDGNDGTPSYERLDVGTDGSKEERAKLANDIRHTLGYPVTTVELRPEQIDLAIKKAIEMLRMRTGVAYKRGYFFLKITSETQKFKLTNCPKRMNTIVQVMGAFRLTSAFLSSAHGAGVYGQIVLQHLYNMGTFDLLSYHIMTEYIKNLEILFAARLTYTFNEDTREISFFHRFPFGEIVLLEATCERTEQDIMRDRLIRPWIRRWALAESRMMLAESRGKYASYPGASGNITFNASDLRTDAKEEFEKLIAEIEDFVVDNPEEYGVYSTLTFG